MTNLSDLFPAGAGKQVSFVADGAISAAGKPVTLKSDGTVSPIVINPANIPLSSEYEQYANAVQYIETKADPFNENRWITIWIDDHGSKYVRISVATRSGSTLTFSPAENVDTTGNASNAGISWDSNVEDQFYIVYNLGSTDYGIVGSVSGAAGSETFTYGTKVSGLCGARLIGGNPGQPVIDLGGSAFYVQWADTTSYYVTGRIITLSGTVPSAGGSSTVLGSFIITGRKNGASINHIDGSRILACGARDSDHKAVIWDVAISGTTITPNTVQVVNTGETSDQYNQITSMGDDVFIYAYESSVDQNVLTFHGTRTGTNTFTWGAEATMLAGDAQAWAIDNNRGTPNDFVAMSALSSAYPKARVGSVSGTTITYGTESVLSSTHNGQYYHMISQSSASDGGFTTQWEPSSFDSLQMRLSDIGGTSLTSTNFIGVSDEAISDTASGNITVKGGIAVNGLTSLTIGSDYYVQADGTFGTSASTPSVKAGIAISATSILLSGDS